MRRTVGALVCLVLAVLAIGAPVDAAASSANGPVYYLTDSARGTTIKRITMTGDRERVGPSAGDVIDVSPNGRWILMGGNSWFGRDIYKARADGGRRVRLTDDDFYGAWPSWSPDGRKIVFSHSDGVEEGYANLYVMDADGSGRRRITTEPGCEIDPTWSPDGSTIAFTRLPAVVLGYGFYCAGTPDIYLVDADGSNLRALRTTADTGEMDPDWSPDGVSLAFTCSTANEASALCVSDGSGQAPDVIFDDGAVASPTWSASGDLIAFAFEPPTEEDIDSEIAVVRSDGSGFRQLTDNHSIDYAPDWGPR